ncbi:glycosyltransferase family 4 protein [Chelativorans salis]|uniref:Glycosyltransferase family 4 protein n=1 Tax=Chelativorans salis TaxID=2978478 RepID=A0ABT2LUK3_9HYPH|nr:glycosyltransferase family 4 protein [Chelativorans sp. EGI FJ00035]MCT7378212.1 glycosyltransferase family 4 protein [Chelativorans sp. EGI FJ00035]
MNRISMIVWNDFQNDARVRKEAETLQAAGNAVTVFALHTPGQTRKADTLPSGVEVVRVTRSPFLNLHRRTSARAGPSAGEEDPPARRIGPVGQAVRLLTRAWAHGILLARMVAARPHVVHAHDVNTLPTAWIAAVLSRAPLVYDAHEVSTDREGYAGFRTAVAWLERRLTPRAAAMITTTEARAKFFARAYGIPRPLVLQNRPRFAAPGRTERIRRELQLQKPWPIVLYQGGLQQGRGLERLVDAAARLEKAYFVFIGGGRLSPALEDQAKSAGLTERVRFMPTVSLDVLPSYTASADIGVQPLENTCFNHYTTDSNKLFEYMMAGLPVVASDMPEIRRIVDAHGFGMIVPPSDTTALANAIGKLIESEALRRVYAEKARHAASRLNWEEQEQKLVALYDRLLKHPGTAYRPDRMKDALDA